MRNSVLAVIFSLFYWSRGIVADDDIKRGTFRFMAFIYYQDESVVDRTGARFLQGAVLVRENYLISSTLTSSISHDPLSKTLVARLGAIRIDTKFSFNEDEDEQEQEIIQISLPLTVNRTSWWAADITLLKTLLPFKMTSAVHVTKLSVKQDYSDKICNIVVFKKKSSSADGNRYLTPVTVEMVPPTTKNCGEKFDERTMVCTVDPQDSSVEDRSPDNFCQGNSGGPLICDNDVMAIQTYIDGNCNPPHLYQLLAPWKKFLDCGTKDYCGNEERCPNVCSVLLKDAPVSLTTIISTEATTRATEETASSEDTEATESTEPTTKSTEEPESESTESGTTETKATEATETTAETSAETEPSASSEVHVETSTVAMNKSHETPWPAPRHDKEEGVTKKDSRETKIEARRMLMVNRASTYSAIDKTTIVFHSLLYNCVIAWISMM